MVLHSLYATVTKVVMATAMAAMGWVVDQANLPDTQDTVIVESQFLHPGIPGHQQNILARDFILEQPV